MVHDVCQARGLWQRRQCRPVDVLGQDCIEDKFAGRFARSHFVLLSLHQLRPRARGPSWIPAGSRRLAGESLADTDGMTTSNASSFLFAVHPSDSGTIRRPDDITARPVERLLHDGVARVHEPERRPSEWKLREMTRIS